MQVREMKAVKAVGCDVILRGSRYVAKVQSYYGGTGTMQVDVWQTSEAAERSLKAAIRAGVTLIEYQRPYVYQSSRAGGGGYDKFTHCIARMWVDGHELPDHCGRSLKPPKGASVFPTSFRVPKGYSLGNYSVELGGYTSCYRKAGFQYLEALGYTVIEGI